MTNETIDKQIQKLNSGEYRDNIFLKPLCSKVDFSSTWIGSSDSDLNQGSGYDIYYIKNEKEYVGAVVDMGQRDLHWFVVPKHRKKGYLSSACKETILPYLLQSRDEQKVTFNATDTDEDAKASTRTATLIGFKQESEEYVIRKENLIMKNDFMDIVPSLSKERYDTIKKRLRTVKNEMNIMSDELRLSANTDLGIDDLVVDLDTVVYNLEETYFKLSRE